MLSGRITVCPRKKLPLSLSCRAEPELSFHVWRQEKSNAKEEKFQRMQVYFEGRWESKILPSHTLAHFRQLPVHIGLLSFGGASQFLLHKDGKGNVDVGGYQQRAEAIHYECLMASPARKRSSLTATLWFSPCLLLRNPRNANFLPHVTVRGSGQSTGMNLVFLNES